MPPKEPGKRGPKAKYQHEKRYQAGAPLLTTRINPETLDWIRSRPEGTRIYLERIVDEDKERVVRADREATANGEDGPSQQSTAPIPGSSPSPPA